MFRFISLFFGNTFVRFLPNCCISFLFFDFNLCFLIHSYNIFKCIFFLYFSNFFLFNILVDLTVVDYFNRFNMFLCNRFELNYCFISIFFNFRIFFKSFINEFFVLDSLFILFKNSLIFEREIFDMFGIFFYNNFGSFFRILLDYGFIGYPLRKDFPVFGFRDIFFSFFSTHIFYNFNYFFNDKKSMYKVEPNWFMFF